MARHWLRRAWLLAAAAIALTLAGCGSSSIESQLVATRIVAFGDAMGDLGQVADNRRYTINDSSVSIWTQQVATDFGLTLTTARTGGQSYAVGNARVVLKPDAAGNSATPTVKEQIDAFLVTNTFTATDIVLVSAGTSDVIVQAAAVIAGTQTVQQMETNVREAALALGTQVRRLVAAGAKQVVVVGPYGLDRSPWALQTSQQSMMGTASARFNENFLISVVDMGANVLYVDLPLFMNLMTASPASYGFSDISTPICTSIDSGPGIGTGSGQVNSSLCNLTTLVTNAVPAAYLFADRIYMTPIAHRQFGDYAFQRIRARW